MLVPGISVILVRVSEVVSEMISPGIILYVVFTGQVYIMK